MPLSNISAGVSFHELVDAAPDGIVVCDSTGTILLVNAQAERMFGYERDDLIGQQIETLIPDRYRPRHPQHLQGYVEQPKARPMGSGLSLFGRRRDGSEFPVEISLSPIQSANGTVVSAAIRDVTDRKAIEAEARRSNAYLISAVDSIQDAFVLYDEEDRIVLVNSRFRQLAGEATKGTIVGKRFVDMLDELLAAGFFAAEQGTPALRKRWIGYHEMPSGALELKTASGSVLRVVEHPTAEHGTVSLFVDITEDRHRSDELRRAREQAEAASAAKSEFLASMSHELRTPLNAVLGFAQLLQRDKKQPLSERQLERVDHVLRGGEHLLRLIDEVLDLSRIEAGAVAISLEPVEIASVLHEVMATLDPVAQRAGVELTAAHGTLPDRVLADRTRLAQILMNFGSNAIKYNHSGGHVRFELARNEDVLRISVADDGIGIPEDKRGKIFEPFHRAGQETGPIQGTGIGLAISKRLAELMHGAVGFTSETGKGSLFWVEVPVARALSVAPAVAEPPSPTLTFADGLRHKIVYVEDNPSNIAFMRELIDDLPGLELITAPTAEIGLELIRAHLPRVVIMDINLPGMSGFDATKQLAAWPETKAIPVIALSAAALTRDTSRAVSAGFYRYLTKPVKVDELMATLEEILAKT
ncbi:MAG TPA: PAS domain S-box protein [Kofleriaceae bacterium]